MRMYIDDPGVISEGVRYFGFSTYCYLFWGLSLVGSNILRSIGQASVPLFTSCLAFVSNVGLNISLSSESLASGDGGGGSGAWHADRQDPGIYSHVRLSFLADRAVRYRLRDIFMPVRHLNREFFKVAFPGRGQRQPLWLRQ